MGFGRFSNSLLNHSSQNVRRDLLRAAVRAQWSGVDRGADVAGRFGQPAGRGMSGASHKASDARDAFQEPAPAEWFMPSSTVFCLLHRARTRKR